MIATVILISNDRKSSIATVILISYGNEQSSLLQVLASKVTSFFNPHGTSTMIPFTASKMSSFSASSFDTNPYDDDFTIFVPVPVVEDPISGPGIEDFDFLILDLN